MIERSEWNEIKLANWWNANGINWIAWIVNEMKQWKQLAPQWPTNKKKVYFWIVVGYGWGPALCAAAFHSTNSLRSLPSFQPLCPSIISFFRNESLFSWTEWMNQTQWRVNWKDSGGGSKSIINLLIGWWAAKPERKGSPPKEQRKQLMKDNHKQMEC